MLKYTYTMDAADITSGTVAVGKRSKSVRSDMHKLMVSTLHQWQQTGDVTQVVPLATEMMEHLDAHYAQGIVNWFAVHAGFEWHPKTKAFTYDKERTTITEEQVLAAKDESFEDLTPPKEAKPFDLNTAIANLLKTAKARAAKPTEGDKIDGELLAKLSELVD